MIVRETSLAAYEKIRDTGVLSQMRWKVYDYLFHHGPLTAGEVTKALKRPDEVHPSYHRRLDELGELGCAKRIRTRPCGVTGEEVYEWDVTGALPNGKIKHAASDTPTLEEQVAAVKELRGIFDRLRKAKEYVAKLKETGAELEPWMKYLLDRSEPFSEGLCDVLSWIDTRAKAKLAKNTPTMPS